jgi:soluble lytic murein transglycosylase-like protein
MRAILVFTILLLGIASAAVEPELFANNMRDDRASAYELVAIESATHRGDRLSLAALQPRALRVELLRRDDRASPIRLASLGSELDVEGNAQTQPREQPTESSAAPGPLSLDNLCNTLFASAQDNDLPVPFFANLLWQESRLRNDVVSKKGAVGIAQFMPKVAVESGLANPFDPMQAIPASARFLQRLRLQFGNLGFVAAAYNAGARRVIEWLEHRGTLPRETRGYVLRVTGLSAETWRKMPIDNEALTFVPRLPCRSLPAFANVEQEQMQQAQLERVQHIRMPSEEELDAMLAAAPAEQEAKKSRPDKQARHNKGDGAHAAARRTAQDRHLAKREAAKHESAKRDAAKHQIAKRDIAKHESVKREAAKHEAAHGQRSGREKRKSA